MGWSFPFPMVEWWCDRGNNIDFFFDLILFIYFCPAGSSLPHAAFSSRGGAAAWCSGFSRCRARASGAWPSVLAALGL